MAPVRGINKKRKVEKKVEENSLASGSSEEGSTEWWNVLSKKIAGIVISFSSVLNQFIVYCYVKDDVCFFGDKFMSLLCIRMFICVVTYSSIGNGFII